MANLELERWIPIFGTPELKNLIEKECMEMWTGKKLLIFCILLFFILVDIFEFNENSLSQSDFFIKIMIPPNSYPLVFIQIT